MQASNASTSMVFSAYVHFRYLHSRIQHAKFMMHNRVQTRVTKLLPQYKHLRTASRTSSSSQLLAPAGSQDTPEPFVGGGKNAFLVQLMQVRVMGVARM